MRIFKRNKSGDLFIQPPPENRLEIELHKNANKEAVAKAKKTNKDLNELLVENGFTIKLYMAAGGSPPRKKQMGKA